MEVCTLLGIREILVVGDLESPVLLNKSDDGERIVVDLVAFDRVELNCRLRSLLHVII